MTSRRQTQLQAQDTAMHNYTSKRAESQTQLTQLPPSKIDFKCMLDIHSERRTFVQLSAVKNKSIFSCRTECMRVNTSSTIHFDFESMHIKRTFVQLQRLISNALHDILWYLFRVVTKLSKTGYVTLRKDFRLPRLTQCIGSYSRTSSWHVELSTSSSY